MQNIENSVLVDIGNSKTVAITIRPTIAVQHEQLLLDYLKIYSDSSLQYLINLLSYGYYEDKEMHDEFMTAIAKVYPFLISESILERLEEKRIKSLNVELNELEELYNSQKTSKEKYLAKKAEVEERHSFMELKLKNKSPVFLYDTIKGGIMKLFIADTQQFIEKSMFFDSFVLNNIIMTSAVDSDIINSQLMPRQRIVANGLVLWLKRLLNQIDQNCFDFSVFIPLELKKKQLESQADLTK